MPEALCPMDRALPISFGALPPTSIISSGVRNPAISPSSSRRVRASHQPENGEGARSDDSSIALGASGRDHSVIDRRTFMTMVGGSVLIAPLAAEGQEARKI